MKPDLNEIKPAGYVLAPVPDRTGQMLAVPFREWKYPVYDQSALEAAHEAGRRAGLEEALDACNRIHFRYADSLAAHYCFTDIAKLLEQKS